MLSLVGYPVLRDEVNAIRASFGFDVDLALEFIQVHSTEYVQTPVYQEFVRYCNATQKMLDKAVEA